MMAYWPFSFSGSPLVCQLKKKPQILDTQLIGGGWRRAKKFSFTDDHHDMQIEWHRQAEEEEVAIQADSQANSG